jgi:hypothetical protein
MKNTILNHPAFTLCAELITLALILAVLFGAFYL